MAARARTLAQNDACEATTLPKRTHAGNAPTDKHGAGRADPDLPGWSHSQDQRPPASGCGNSMAKMWLATGVWTVEELLEWASRVRQKPTAERVAKSVSVSRTPLSHLLWKALCSWASVLLTANGGCQKRKAHGSRDSPRPMSSSHGRIGIVHQGVSPAIRVAGRHVQPLARSSGASSTASNMSRLDTCDATTLNTESLLD
jgi:hypothetical protein